MHLGLHNIDTAGFRVTQVLLAIDVIEGNQAGNNRIHNTLGDFITLLIKDGGISHQMAHIADKHQAAPLQGQALAVSCQVLAIGVHSAQKTLVTAHNLLFQAPTAEAEPVTVGQGLILGIYCSH